MDSQPCSQLLEQLRIASIPESLSVDDHQEGSRRPMPVYGRGLNVRDWLFVDDHVRR